MNNNNTDAPSIKNKLAGCDGYMRRMGHISWVILRIHVRLMDDVTVKCGDNVRI